jgi:hypothetical protein
MDAHDTRAWSDVPADLRSSWFKLFDSSSEGLNVAGACPVCSAASLHRWFSIRRARPSQLFGRSWQGDGGQWQWCSTCHSYTHTSGLVPMWWQAPFEVPRSELRADPDLLEQYRLSNAGTSDSRITP